MKKSTERILGLSSDPVNRTYWVYSDASLFELKVNNETRDIWQIFMKRGEFDTALQYARVSRSERARL